MNIVMGSENVVAPSSVHWQHERAAGRRWWVRVEIAAIASSSPLPSSSSSSQMKNDDKQGQQHTTANVGSKTCRSDMFMIVQWNRRAHELQLEPNIQRLGQGLKDRIQASQGTVHDHSILGPAIRGYDFS